MRPFFKIIVQGFESGVVERNFSFLAGFLSMNNKGVIGFNIFQF